MLKTELLLPAKKLLAAGGVYLQDDLSIFVEVSNILFFFFRSSFSMYAWNLLQNNCNSLPLLLNA